MMILMAAALTLISCGKNDVDDLKQERFLDVSYGDDDDSTEWEKSNFGGTYKPAVREDMATYDRYSH